MENINEIEEQIHLSDYWNVIKKRKILILAFVAVTVTVTLILSFTMKPVYQASAGMSIEREKTSSPLTGRSTEYISSQSQLLTFNTHFQLINSKPVIRMVLDALKEAAKPDEVEEVSTNPVQEILAQVRGAVSRLKKNIKLLIRKEQKQFTEQEILDMQVSGLQSQINVSNVRDTRIMSIGVLDIDPTRAAQIANLLADKYIEFDMASRLESSKATLKWLNKELYRLKKRLEDDEKAFYEYKQRNKVFSLEGKQKVIDQKISEFNNEYLLVKNKRQELEAKLTEVAKLEGPGGGNLGHIRSIVSNSAIDAIYSNLTSLELEMTRLTKVYKAKHPKILQITSEIAKVKAKLQGELQKEVNNLRVQHQVYETREKVLSRNLDEFEEDALDASGKELKYTILQRNMTTSQNLYDTLMAKIKESGILSEATTSNLRIVERAAVPIAPIKPNKKKNFLLSLLVGLFGGIGLAFFLEYLDQSIRTEEDVEKVLGLPVLSVIPVADKAEKGGYY